MKQTLRIFSLVVLLWLALRPASGQAAPARNGPWTFAVSGDSRDCGDVVMPAIAAGARQHGAVFYWHLGDFRHISDYDPDMQHDAKFKNMIIDSYLNFAWPDFIESQLAPFGEMPVMLGIGNHELATGRTRAEYLIQFADWLDAPILRAQRLKDDAAAHRLQTYYHWVMRGVAFYSLDNGSFDMFDVAQLKWFEKNLAVDAADRSITTIVVGMHEALPESLSKSHSMNQSDTGTMSGRQVYGDLLALRDRKHVYVLASHSHFYMSNVYNTEYWRTHGGVLPGWIVGTAGAARQPLPKQYDGATEALERTYGYLTGAVQSNGEIRFEFHKIEERDIPAPVVARYGADFVHWSFTDNLSPTFSQHH